MTINCLSSKKAPFIRLQVQLYTKKLTKNRSVSLGYDKKKKYYSMRFINKGAVNRLALSSEAMDALIDIYDKINKQDEPHVYNIIYRIVENADE